MIHPILNLPEAGPFNSNFVEAIIQPGWSAELLAGTDGRSLRQVYRRRLQGGDACSHAFRRPAMAPAPVSTCITPIVPKFRLYHIGPGRGAPGVESVRHRGLALRRWLNREPFGISRERDGTRCRLAGGTSTVVTGLSKHNNPYSPIGDGTLLDIGVWNIPGYQPQNWNDGVRLHTLVGPTELTWLLLQ